MATTWQLLGPPELYAPPPITTSSSETTVAVPVNSNTSATDNQPSPDDNLFLLDFGKESNLESSVGRPLMGFTENLSPTFLSTGNPCLDFFFHIVPDTPRESLIARLELAWAHDPLMALKLICNLRGVRGTGKSDKEGFYTAALWLHSFHPKTLAGNVKAIAEFGYFKDFLEILYRILEGPLVRETDKQERQGKSGSGLRVRKGRIGKGRKKSRGQGKDLEEVKEKVVKNLEEINLESEKARDLRKEKELNKAKRALQRYRSDEKFRSLHEAISDFFAELLRVDIENLNAGNLRKISLAAKWCPKNDSSYDKVTLICETIARKMFPIEKFSEYKEMEERHYVYKVRDRLRKEILVPLRKALELPEVYMSANKWDSLPYNRVASVAMKNYKSHFLKHDEERFKKYLEDVKSGKAKIAAGALLPHEIIQSALMEEYRDGVGLAELQWRRMVEDMIKKGKLSNCISVCDVSLSMSGIPMEVCVALGILVSELSEEPWKGKVITFSDDPELHKIEGETLMEKSKFVREMNWGGSTNFQGVFDRILEVAVGGKLKEEELVKRVFVFSDMEFNSASRNPWETDYQAIQRKFNENGYGRVPEIVFWNLRDSRATPVTEKQNGVALVSGFSKNLLTLFLEEGGIVNPEQVMELSIAGEEYQKLAVFD